MRAVDLSRRRSLSVPLWGPDAQDPLSVCRPLGIEIHALAAKLLDGWKPPEPPAYKGAHGSAHCGAAISD